MRRSQLLSVMAGAMVAVVLLCGAGEVSPADAPQYDKDGKMIVPADYREWIFLSSGLDMSYSQLPSMMNGHMFNNVFVQRGAYLEFKKTGVWPDRTILLLENRGGATDVSINKRGMVQTQEIMGMEAHVKDTRFKGGWAFFGFDGDKPAEEIEHTASCYSCHESHAAADTTFVQFYPTLLPIATKLGTLNPSYVAETTSKPGK
jgi:Cytochrome P460